MKKKISLLLLTLVCAMACAFGLAACVGGGDNNPPPVTPKTVQATIKVSFGFEREDYITGTSFSFGDTGISGWGELINDTMVYVVDSHETTNFNDAALKISLKKGLNPQTLGVAEKDGKPVTKEYDTQYNKNDVIIKMPFAENLEYNLTLTAPDAVYQDFGFKIDDAEILNYKANEALVEMFDNAQVWVEDADGTGNAGWVALTKYWVNPVTQQPDYDNRLLNAADFVSKADLSKNYFPVYVRFDANDAGKVIYNNYYRDLLKFNDNTASSVEYVQIPGTNEYAIAYNFSTYDLSSTNHICLNAGQLKENLAYKTSTIKTTFSVVTLNQDGYKYTYNFKLSYYSVDGGQVQMEIPSTLNKKYGESYKLRYSLNNIEVTSNPGHDWITQDHINAQKQKLESYTDFENITLTLNGKKLTTGVDFFTTAGYEYTIGAYEIPYTYSGELDDEFAFNMDIESIKVKSAQTKVVNIKTTNNVSTNGVSFDIFSRFEKDGYTYTKEFYESGISAGASMSAPTGKFKFNITVDSTSYTKTFIPGVDYLTAVDDKTGYIEALQNANILSFAKKDFFYKGEQESDQIYYEFSNNGDLYIQIWWGYENSLTKQTDITIELIELEDDTSRDIAIEVTGARVNGDFTINGEQTTTIKTNEDSDLYIPLNDSDNYPDYTVELYSNDVLIVSAQGTYLSGNGDECKIDGYNTDWSKQFFKNPDGGSSDSIRMNRIITTSGYLFLHDSEYNLVVIQIDKIVITVNA